MTTRISYQNSRGLPDVYNEAIAEASGTGAVLVFWPGGLMGGRRLNEALAVQGRV